MAFRTQKISQMTPKGANLEGSDLLEVSTLESGSYVTRSITGQEIIDAAASSGGVTDVTATAPIVSTGGTTPDISMAAADAGHDGYLSSTDWIAFNNKQDALTLTTTGTSGAATLVGTTLNIPQYSGGGGGGQKGIHAPFTLISGQIASSSLLGNGFSATASIANRLWAVPFYPSQSITSLNLFVNLTSGVAAAIGRILIYSELNGDPYQKLFESTDIDCSTAGVKTITTTFNFIQDTKYFICWHGSSNPNMTNIPITSLMMLPQRSSSSLLAWSSFFLGSISVGSAPATWSGGSLTNTAVPFIGITSA